MLFVNAEILDAANMEGMKKNPEIVRIRFLKPRYQHDREAYVYEKCGQGFEHLVFGPKFQDTNLPQSHKLEP